MKTFILTLQTLYAQAMTIPISTWILKIIQFYTPISFRKAVKATVVLLPLFGLHWLLTLYRPQNGHCIWLTCYKYLNVALDGLQGLMVAIAFCYRNGEVSLKPFFDLIVGLVFMWNLGQNFGKAHFQFSYYQPCKLQHSTLASQLLVIFIINTSMLFGEIFHSFLN